MRRTLSFTALALLLNNLSLSAQSGASPLALDPAAREESRQFFRTIFLRAQTVPLQWTGSAATGSAGDTSAAFKEAVRLRINYFRAMASVPAGVVLDAGFNARAQQAALMVGANQQAIANPPASWIFYSAAGAEGAANSNLLLDQTGAEAITTQMQGGDDPWLAHRRWLLYPWTRVMGTGDVPAAGSLRAANATWVMDSANFSGVRPNTRDSFVAWPPRGFVPYQVVFPRWSFAVPGADFSAATVTMTRAGASVPVRLETVASGPGENTLVWVFDNLDPRQVAAHPRPASDTTYSVTIAGVRGTGVAPGFSYDVTVFDPEVAGSEAVPPTVNGSITPAVGQGSPYNFFLPALAGDFEWRVVRFAPFSEIYGAEGGQQGLLATTTGSYAVRDSTRPAAGGAAYRLAHETAEPQLLMLPGSYFAPMGAPGTLVFRSMLVSAGTRQAARVQVSTDDGAVWRDLYVQAGSGGPGETGYRAVSVSLAEVAGRTFRLRFAFTVDGGPPAGTTGGAAWYLDEISLGGVRQVEAEATQLVASGSTFRITPTAAGSVALQARGRMFGAIAMEWSLVSQVVAIGGGGGDPGRLVNLAIRTRAGTGAQTLIMGVSIGGSATSGNKPLLIRGVGPSLAAFGVTGFLADPVLAVLAGSSIVASNDNWENNPQVAAAMPQVGAFPLASASSRDAALVTSRGAGGYTVQITGAGGGTGIALAEVYDSTPGGGFFATTPRLTNVSARAHVGTGGEILIAGFTIGGTTEKTVLVRAVGPTLAGLGVSDVLVDPRLEVYSAAGARLAGNDNWVASENLLTAAASVGAFALPSGSADAAVLVTLQPGSYTAQVSGVGDRTGVALVEVYEVP